MSFSILAFVLFVALFTVSNNALAQGSESDSTNHVRNSLQSSCWAFEFGISSNFTLTSFQGTVLSVKRQLNKHEAVELGIGGYLNNQDNSGSSQNNWGDTLTYGSSLSGSNKYGNFQINLRYVYYPNPDADVNLYLGAGPTFGYYRSNYNNDNTPVLPQPPDANLYINYPNSSIQSQTSWNAGVSAAAGVECFILKYLSIHAQYGISLVYTKGDYSTDYIYHVFDHGQMMTSASSNTSDSHGWQINPASVLFGLSVYLK